MPEYLYQLRNKGLFGYVDFDGNVVVDPIYAYVGDFAEGLGYRVEIAQSSPEKAVTVIDHCNRELGKFLAESVFDCFSSGSLRFTRNGFWGAVDSSGMLVLPPSYDSLVSVENCFVVAQDLRWGVLSRTKDWIVPQKYDGLALRNGIITASVQDTVELISITDGRILLRIKATESGVYSEGLLPIRLADSRQWSWVNGHGDLLGNTFDEVGISFEQQTIPVRIGQKWGIANPSGELILEPTYDYIGNLVSGMRIYASGGKALALAGQFRDSKWGFLDADGKIVVAAYYDGVENFNGYCTVVFNKINDSRSYSVIDKSGRVVCKWT